MIFRFGHLFRPLDHVELDPSGWFTGKGKPLADPPLDSLGSILSAAIVMAVQDINGPYIEPTHFDFIFFFSQ